MQGRVYKVDGLFFSMNVKNLVLGVGIFIVYLLMLNYGIEAFYPSPVYNDICKGQSYPYPMKYTGEMPTPGQNCSFSQTVQDAVNQCNEQGGYPVYTYDSLGCTTGVKECNMCNKEYEDAQKTHSKIVFVIALIVGIITLFVGFGILSVEPVGSALMASGVGAIFYGSARNWANLSDIWRFLLLVLSLVLLIWIALRINKERRWK